MPTARLRWWPGQVGWGSVSCRSSGDGDGFYADLDCDGTAVQWGGGGETTVYLNL